MTNGKITEKFDLEERIAKFGEEFVEFTKRVPQNTITVPILAQLVKAGTSIGAKYCEADDAASNKLG